MYIIFPAIIAFTVLAIMWRAYERTGDVFHPAVYLGPMFVYSYAYRPLVIEWGGWMNQLFNPTQLAFVMTINLIGTGSFLLGTLWHVDYKASHAPPRHHELSAESRSRATMLGAILGGLALAGFWLGILLEGGLTNVYGQAKGGVIFATGYVGEAPMLAFPALGLLALAWQDMGFTISRFLTMLLFTSPIWVHGLLGARRGPTFMIGMALLFALFVIARRKPRLFTVVSCVLVLGVLTIWLVNNRGRIYIGSAWEEQSQMDVTYADRGGTGTGDDWAYASGVLLTSREFGRHTWGWRFIAQMIVQPIPRQFWPTKYDDVGLSWITDQGASCGMTDNEWRTAVGWVPATGSAGGIICDFFMEFSYLSIVACFAFGWLHSLLWYRSSLRGGVWNAMYLFVVILSIFVTTQNFNAWYYRFALMSIPTALIWTLYLAERPRAMRMPAVTPRLPRQRPRPLSHRPA